MQRPRLINDRTRPKVVQKEIPPPPKGCESEVPLNPKAAKARENFFKYNKDQDGGKAVIGKGHVIEARNQEALQFFTTHHDYRRGKIRENFVPAFPTGDELFQGPALQPGADFAAMYNIEGISCYDDQGEPVCPPQITSFADVTLTPQLISNLQKMNITKPLPIQQILVPFLLNHPDQDIVATAPTGSGKTLAIMLPLIEHCIQLKKNEPSGRPPNAPFVIVIGATRDLVHQLCLDALRLSHDTGILVKCAYGEYERETNARHVKEGCDIFIATVGRFVDLVDKDDVFVNHARFMAVDEADKLIKDELFQDLLVVLKDRIRPDVVHALFSATFGQAVQNILPQLLRKNFMRVELHASGISPTVKQKFYNVLGFKRQEHLLKTLLKDATVLLSNEISYDTANFVNKMQYSVKKTIIFGDVRRQIDCLAIFLSVHGIRAISMHGGRSQSQRNEAWDGFINGEFQVLCASNVAGRGLNFPDVELIINFDPPTDFDTYVHRIGRGGRLGGNATSITYLVPENASHMELAQDIVRELVKLNQRIPPFLNEMASRFVIGN